MDKYWKDLILEQEIFINEEPRKVSDIMGHITPEEIYFYLANTSEGTKIIKFKSKENITNMGDLSDLVQVISSINNLRDDYKVIDSVATKIMTILLSGTLPKSKYPLWFGILKSTCETRLEEARLLNFDSMESISKEIRFRYREYDLYMLSVIAPYLESSNSHLLLPNIDEGKVLFITNSGTSVILRKGKDFNKYSDFKEMLYTKMPAFDGKDEMYNYLYSLENDNSFSSPMRGFDL